jgi:hypothetical protein
LTLNPSGSRLASRYPHLKLFGPRPDLLLFIISCAEMNAREEVPHS